MWHQICATVKNICDFFTFKKKKKKDHLPPNKSKEGFYFWAQRDRRIFDDLRFKNAVTDCFRVPDIYTLECEKQWETTANELRGLYDFSSFLNKVIAVR